MVLKTACLVEPRNRQAKVDVEPNATSLIIKALKEPLREPWPMDPWIRRGGVALCFVKEMGGPTKNNNCHMYIYNIYIYIFVLYIYVCVCVCVLHMWFF